MTLATLIGKIRQEALLWFSLTIEREGSKLVSFFAKIQGKSSKDCRNNNSNHNGKHFTSNCKFKYNPNVTYHYCGRKRHIALDCKDKARDHANGVFKSQANVGAQGSSTLALASLVETFQLFMAIVVEENNYTYIWYLNIGAT